MKSDGGSSWKEPEMSALPLPAFEARVDTVMRVRSLPRLEAERAAYEIVLVEFLNRTYPDTPSDGCAWCGQPETG
jgi:hypothetical protein